MTLLVEDYVGLMLFLSVMAIVVIPVLLVQLHHAQRTVDRWRDLAKSWEDRYEEIHLVLQELRSIPEDMVDRAMSVQGLRSDHKSDESDRHWMRSSLHVAINAEQESR